jgi:hypothetical protein
MQLEEQLEFVPCSRDSGRVPADKNRASSWKISEDKLSAQPKGIEKLVAWRNYIVTYGIQ